MSLLRYAALVLALGMTSCDSPVSHPSAATLPSAKPSAATVPAAIQSIHFEVVSETVTGPRCEGAEEGSRPLEVTRNFLHLMGPDTLRPALQALQCPTPARRHALLKEELQSLDCENDEFGHYAGTEVTFNSGGVLTLLLSESTSSGGPYPNNEFSIRNYDLVTGRTCPLAEWLRPDKEQALRQLLTRYLLTDSIGRDLLPVSGISGLETKPYLLAELPEMGVNQQGIFCLLANFGAPHVIQQAVLTIPFAALRPYVRLGSPLARAMADVQ